MGFLEVAFVRQHPLPVRLARAGRVGPHYFGERPADGPGRPPVAQVLGDVAVGSNAARGNPGDDGPDALEERSLFVGLNGHGDNPASLTEYSERYRKNRGRPAGAFSIQPSQLAYIQG